MAYIKRPQRGQKTLQSLFDSVNSIIDYLPTLTVRGDNYSTSVEQSSNGTIVHAKQPYDTTQNGGKSNYYFAGEGLHLSGNIFSNALSGDGSTIAINNNVISCLLQPGSGGPYIDHNTTYTGELNVSWQSGGCCGFIWVDEEPFSGDTYIIRSTLRYLNQLYNPPLNMYQYSPHFLLQTDLKSGAGISVNYISATQVIPASGTTPSSEYTYYTGMQFNVAMSGGRFTSPTFHKGTNIGTDFSSAYIDCLLSGDNQHIIIRELTGIYELNPDYGWGGIISTNIHGDESSIHMADDGTLSLLSSAVTQIIDIHGGGGSGAFYTGELNVGTDYYGCPCGWIWVDPNTIKVDGVDTHVIYSNLRYLQQLWNAPLSSPATPHILTQNDLQDGRGTTVNYLTASQVIPASGDTPSSEYTYATGISVDFALSGYHGIQIGYSDTTPALPSAKWDKIYLQDDFYNDLTTIKNRSNYQYTNRVLVSNSGRLDWEEYTPATPIEYTGISPISVNNSNHTISFTGSIPSGGGGGLGVPDYQYLVQDENYNVFPYGVGSSHGAGWLRVSIKSASQCVVMNIGGSNIELGTGNYTGLYAVPANASVSFPSGNGTIFARFTEAVGGGLGTPDYSALATSSLALNTQHKASANGWARVSLKSANTCVQLCVNGSRIQLGRGNCTTLWPIAKGSIFGIPGTGLGEVYLYFDGGVSSP